MNSVDVTIYLINDIVSGAVGAFQIVYFTPTPSLPLDVNLSNVHVLSTLLSWVLFLSGMKKSFGISHIIVECFLVSGSGGKLSKSIETLLFVQEERAIMVCFCCNL